jgi:hypothetical protein
VNELDDIHIKIYQTDLPRVLGLFHFARSYAGTPGADKRAGSFGVISQVGPCRCGNPSHSFPRYYSVTPCVYVRALGWMLTVRVPVWFYDALLGA